MYSTLNKQWDEDHYSCGNPGSIRSIQDKSDTHLDDCSMRYKGLKNEVIFQHSCKTKLCKNKDSRLVSLVSLTVGKMKYFKPSDPFISINAVKTKTEQLHSSVLQYKLLSVLMLMVWFFGQTADLRFKTICQLQSRTLSITSPEPWRLATDLSGGAVKFSG